MKEKKTGGKVIKIILIVFLVMLLAFFLLVMCTPDESENGGGAEGETAETEESYRTAENKGRNEAEKADTNTDTKPYGDPDTSWTIMLYLCGTDLESDVFGNETVCDPIIMEIKDGEMYAYEME